MARIFGGPVDMGFQPSVGKAHRNRRPRRGPCCSWLARVDEIIERVEETRLQYFDRHDVEQLFALRTTAACKVINQIGRAENLQAVLGASTHLQANVVARRDLLLFLHRTRQSPEAFNEHMRKTRLTEELAEAGRILKARRIPVQPIPVKDETIAGLPAGIHLSEGKLVIEFFGFEDLMSHLFALAKAAMHDAESLRAAVEDLRSVHSLQDRGRHPGNQKTGA